MFTRAFWKDAAERAISSAAGGALTAMGLGTLNVLHADWQVIAGSAAGTGLVALLKALVASSVGDPKSASLVDLGTKPADYTPRHAAAEETQP